MKKNFLLTSSGLIFLFFISIVPFSYSEEIKEFIKSDIHHSSNTAIEALFEKKENFMNEYNQKYSNSSFENLNFKEIPNDSHVDVSILNLKEIYRDTPLLWHVYLNGNYSNNLQFGSVDLKLKSENSNYLLAAGTIDEIEEYFLNNSKVKTIFLPHLKTSKVSSNSIYDPYALHNSRYSVVPEIPFKSETSVFETNSQKTKREMLVPSMKINPSIPKLFNSNNQSEIFFSDTDSKNRLQLSVYAKPEFLSQIPSWLNVSSIHNYENSEFPHVKINSWLSISDVNLLERVESVILIDSILRPISNNHESGHTTGDGITITHADDLHLQGITGDSVRVAVIDTGFDMLDPVLNVPNVVDTNFFGCAGINCFGAPGYHGNLVAEIVLDMAPDSELLLYAAFGNDDFVDAVDEARNNNADIIISSIGWFTDGGKTKQYLDGTSKTADAYTRASNEDGILTINAAANQGNLHTFRTYTEVPIGLIPDLPLGFHHGALEFDPTETGAMRACLPLTATEGTNTLFVTWDDWSWDPNGRFDDYNVFVYDDTMSNRLFSTGGTDSQIINYPKELVLFGVAQGVESVCIVITKGGAFPTETIYDFHIHSRQNFEFPTNHIVSAGSLFTPADGPETIAVGAIDSVSLTWWDDSSQGPTDDGRIKPEICAPTNVELDSSKALGPFGGTSAATPHVAGAAALLLEQDPTLSVNDLRQILIDKATFDSSYSINNICGADSGLLSLACSPPQSGDWIINFDCILPENTVAPGNVIVENNAVLTIPNGLVLDIDFLTSHLEIKTGSQVMIKQGGQIT